MKTIYVICFFPFYVFDSNQIFALDLCLSGYMFWEILFLFFFNSVFSKDVFANLIFLFFRFSFFYKFFFTSYFLQALFLCLGCTSIFHFQSCKFASQVLFFQDASTFQMGYCFMLESPKCGTTKSHTFSKNLGSLQNYNECFVIDCY